MVNFFEGSSTTPKVPPPFSTSFLDFEEPKLVPLPLLSQAASSMKSERFSPSRAAA